MKTRGGPKTKNENSRGGLHLTPFHNVRLNIFNQVASANPCGGFRLFRKSFLGNYFTYIKIPQA